VNDDPNHVGCPNCGDDSDSCLCFVVLTWEGSHLADWRGDLDNSSLDRILHWGHGAALLGAPPSRGRRPLAALPGRLAAAIEAYWLEASVAVELEDLHAFRKAYDEGDGTPRSEGDPDPSESGHPRHAEYRAALLEHFEEDLCCHDTLPDARIAAHVAWAELSAAETESVTTRTDGVGTSSIWESVTSPDPEDTWRRMEAMLKPALAVIEEDR
jgi:hypothetical protein